MEEAAFISPTVFYKVVVPLLGVENTGLVGISTPGGSNNYYSILINQKLNGEYLFQMLAVGLSCNACQDEGKSNSCPHRRSVLPAWKNDALQALQKAILPPEIYAAEALGINADSKQPAFNGAEVSKAFAAKRVFIKSTIPHKGFVWIYLDPSPGGASAGKSRMALTAFVVTNQCEAGSGRLRECYTVSFCFFSSDAGFGFGFGFAAAIAAAAAVAAAVAIAMLARLLLGPVPCV